MKTTAKRVTLAKQIAVIEDEIECRERSHTDAWGPHKGTIRPGKERRDWLALKAARDTLKGLARLAGKNL